MGNWNIVWVSSVRLVHYSRYRTKVLLSDIAKLYPFNIPVTHSLRYYRIVFPYCVLLMWTCRSCLGNVLSVLVFPGTMPLTMQEQALVEDLLFVLIGVEGRDITAQPVLGRQSRSFIVDPSLDMSIKELVNRILPVASCYSTVTRLAKFLPLFPFKQLYCVLFKLF